MGRAEEAGVLAGSTLMARRKMVGPRRRERTGRRQGEEDMPSVDVWIYRPCFWVAFFSERAVDVSSLFSITYNKTNVN